MSHTDHGQHFPGGARRSDRKPRFDLIPFELLEAIAEALTEGTAKYGPHNWKRGGKDFFLDAWNHAFVHLQKFKEGDRCEDHLAHLACNVAFLIWAVTNRIISQEDFDSITHPPDPGGKTGSQGRSPAHRRQTDLADSPSYGDG